jgi:hypothetical protein
MHLSKMAEHFVKIFEGRFEAESHGWDICNADRTVQVASIRDVQEYGLRTLRVLAREAFKGTTLVIIWPVKGPFPVILFGIRGNEGLSLTTGLARLYEIDLTISRLVPGRNALMAGVAIAVVLHRHQYSHSFSEQIHRGSKGSYT